MARKISTITLAFLGPCAPSPVDATPIPEPKLGESPPPAWRVLTVTDSTDHSPGVLLRQKTVDALCADEHWKVTIVRPKGDAL